MDFTKEICGHTLEYIDDDHIYLVNGIVVPSITQMLRVKFGNKYASVDRKVLKRASDKGTEVHEAIERFCLSHGEDVADLPEVRNFRFLQNMYKFEVIGNEIPVILFNGGKPISAGRLDLVLRMGDDIGGADIKRTFTLDKEYLAYQLNLYRIAYLQSYGVEWKFLRGIHLRDDVRKFVPIPINKEIAWDLIHEYQEVSR